MKNFNIYEISLDGRKCTVLQPAGHVRHAAILCGWNLPDMLPALSEELPDTVLFFTEADGSREFTPWAAEAVWDNESFTGEADSLLSFLLSSALPYLSGTFGISSPQDLLIAGYSLGGLFALWAAYSSNRFGLTASLSGSVWYPDFLDFVRKNMPCPDIGTYLSLGDREPFGGPAVLRTVGKCTEELYAMLIGSGYDAVFEWNRGGHAKGIENRWRKALRWAAKKWGQQNEAADTI